MAVQDMLADALAEVALLREKHLLDHKAIQLLQRKACMLASAADMGAEKSQDETNTLERKLQGQLVERECQVCHTVIIFMPSCSAAGSIVDLSSQLGDADG